MTPVIEIKDLAKSYRVYQKREGLLGSVRGLFRREFREVHAVRGIDLTVDQGEFVAFLGPNGAGKTTLLKTIAGLVPAAEGHVAFAGADITNPRAHELPSRGLVMVPEGRGVFPNLTVRENLTMAARVATSCPNTSPVSVQTLSRVRRSKPAP